MTEENRAKDQARAQYESILSMVAALMCNYDTLEETRDDLARLRDEFDELNTAKGRWLTENPGNFIECDDPRDAARWALAHPDEAEQLDQLHEDIRSYEAYVTELEEDAGDCESLEDAERAIHEDPLSVAVRGGWYSPTDDDKPDAEEFQILLCTGGPAVRIMGELDQHCEPRRAWLEYQDLGTPWTKYDGYADSAVLLVYCQQFYFGG